MMKVAKLSTIGLMWIVLCAGVALSGCTGETDSGDEDDSEAVDTPALKTETKNACEQLSDDVCAPPIEP